MKHTIFYLLILILPTACSKQQSKRYTIGFSQRTQADNWRKTMLAGMNQELSFYPDVDFVIKDAGGQSDRQVGQIRNSSTSGSIC